MLLSLSFMTVNLFRGLLSFLDIRLVKPGNGDWKDCLTTFLLIRKLTLLLLQNKMSLFLIDLFLVYAVCWTPAGGGLCVCMSVIGWEGGRCLYFLL